jgi:hypothetical protein
VPPRLAERSPAHGQLGRGRGRRKARARALPAPCR